jgi:hypothetical protein
MAKNAVTNIHNYVIACAPIRDFPLTWLTPLNHTEIFESRIAYLFSCPTCKKPRAAPGTRFCSNSFHLWIDPMPQII